MHKSLVTGNPDSPISDTPGSLATCSCQWMVLNSHRDIADRNSLMQQFYTSEILDGLNPDFVLLPDACLPGSTAEILRRSFETQKVSVLSTCKTPITLISR
jgi:hypothetical protein